MRWRYWLRTDLWRRLAANWWAHRQCLKPCWDPTSRKVAARKSCCPRKSIALSSSLSITSLRVSWLLSLVCHLYIITVYPKKYAHGFVVLCFVVVMQSFIMNSHEVFIHIHQGCFAGTGAIVRLSQCQWSKPDGYGKISPCITTTKHSKAKTVCIFLGIYCIIRVILEFGCVSDSLYNAYSCINPNH